MLSEPLFKGCHIFTLITLDFLCSWRVLDGNPVWTFLLLLGKELLSHLQRIGGLTSSWPFGWTLPCSWWVVRSQERTSCWRNNCIRNFLNDLRWSKTIVFGILIHVFFQIKETLSKKWVEFQLNVTLPISKICSFTLALAVLLPFYLWPILAFIAAGKQKGQGRLTEEK